MTVAVSPPRPRGPRRWSAPPPAHGGERRRLRSAWGHARRSDRAGGQDRHRQARPGADARRSCDRPARQLRRGPGAGARAGRAPSDRARQLGQRLPGRGPEDRGLRGLRRAGRAARRALHPRGQRGQRDRLVEGASRSTTPLRSMHGYRAEGRRRWCTAGPSRSPETVASAIRIGNPARWEDAMNAFTASRGEVARSPTPRSSTPTHARRARGRVLRAGLGGLGGGAAALRRRGPRGLRAHGARAEGPADGDEPRRSVVPCEPDIEAWSERCSDEAPPE